MQTNKAKDFLLYHALQKQLFSSDDDDTSFVLDQRPKWNLSNASWMTNYLYSLFLRLLFTYIN